MPSHILEEVKKNLEEEDDDLDESAVTPAKKEFALARGVKAVGSLASDGLKKLGRGILDVGNFITRKKSMIRCLSM